MIRQSSVDRSSDIVFDYTNAENSRTRKADWPMVHLVRELHASGIQLIAIANAVPLSVAQVGKIARGERWRAERNVP